MNRQELPGEPLPLFGEPRTVEVFQEGECFLGHLFAHLPVARAAKLHQLEALARGKEAELRRRPLFTKPEGEDPAAVFETVPPVGGDTVVHLLSLPRQRFQRQKLMNLQPAEVAGSEERLQMELHLAFHDEAPETVPPPRSSQQRGDPPPFEPEEGEFFRREGEGQGVLSGEGVERRPAEVERVAEILAQRLEMALQFRQRWRQPFPEGARPQPSIGPLVGELGEKGEKGPCGADLVWILGTAVGGDTVEQFQKLAEGERRSRDHLATEGGTDQALGDSVVAGEGADQVPSPIDRLLHLGGLAPRDVAPATFEVPRGVGSQEEGRDEGRKSVERLEPVEPGLGISPGETVVIDDRVEVPPVVEAGEEPEDLLVEAFGEPPRRLMSRITPGEVGKHRCRDSVKRKGGGVFPERNLIGLGMAQEAPDQLREEILLTRRHATEPEGQKLAVFQMDPEPAFSVLQTEPISPEPERLEA